MGDEDELIVSMIGEDDDSVVATGSKPIPLLGGRQINMI